MREFLEIVLMLTSIAFMVIATVYILFETNTAKAMEDMGQRLVNKIRKRHCDLLIYKIKKRAEFLPDDKKKKVYEWIDLAMSDGDKELANQPIRLRKISHKVLSMLSTEVQ